MPNGKQYSYLYDIRFARINEYICDTFTKKSLQDFVSGNMGCPYALDKRVFNSLVKKGYLTEEVINDEIVYTITDKYIFDMEHYNLKEINND